MSSKSSKKAQKQAAIAQIRAGRRAEEEAARSRSEQSDVGRRLRRAGRRSLAFLGFETGLPGSQLGG